MRPTDAPHNQISIHAPRMGSDAILPYLLTGNFSISIHAPRMGSDDKINTAFLLEETFLSTPPAWGATKQLSPARFRSRISIHAPRMGSDTAGWRMYLQLETFLSTPPAWGATASRVMVLVSSFQFLSTPPAWGATRTGSLHRQADGRFLSTPPAWGATRQAGRVSRTMDISIHAPRMGSDRAGIHRRQSKRISIHAPRMGSDREMAEDTAGAEYFYPRPPHGERHAGYRQTLGTWRFLSTPPAWGATLAAHCLIRRLHNFYPRPPHGERPD